LFFIPLSLTDLSPNVNSKKKRSANRPFSADVLAPASRNLTSWNLNQKEVQNDRIRRKIMIFSDF
ncbi:hypothetical protein EBS43_06775, partial [bacterium]|nr:hypothetical protein [bacterium]